MTKERIRLAEAIQALRRELQEAMTSDGEAWLRFEPACIELTVETEVTTAGEGSLGVKWLLIEAGAEASHQRRATQTITLKLTPKSFSSDGRPMSTYLLGVDDR